MKIAIIGASNNKEKYSNKAVRAFASQGWVVYPINPKEKEIEGLKCYSKITDIKKDLDTISMYVPANIGIKLIPDFVKKKIKKVYVNPGAESDELMKELEKADIRAIVACSILAVGKDPSEL